MTLEEFLQRSVSLPKEAGRHGRIVLSSRVRLARNLRGYFFPRHAKKVQRIKAMEQVKAVVESLPLMRNAYFETMDRLPSLDREILVERHLISREHAAKRAGSGVVFAFKESLSVMINEEDHLRMQALLPGLQLKEAWKAIDKLDSMLEKKLPYAFSEKLGYLTACPTNLGTAIRVSAMLHLPALVLSDQVNQIIQAVNKLGLAVRGLYGEGTEALGNVFQISNQMTLGETELEILERINKVLAQLIEHEEDARETLMENRPKAVFNQVGRAYGILSNAHSIASKETLNLLSMVQLGIDLGLFPDLDRCIVEELFILSQPAHLQRNLTNKLSAEKRDILRADMLRERFESIRRPNLVAGAFERTRLDKSEDSRHPKG